MILVYLYYLMVGKIMAYIQISIKYNTSIYRQQVEMSYTLKRQLKNQNQLYISLQTEGQSCEIYQRTVTQQFLKSQFATNQRNYPNLSDVYKSLQTRKGHQISIKDHSITVFMNQEQMSIDLMKKKSQEQLLEERMLVKLEKLFNNRFKALEDKLQAKINSQFSKINYRKWREDLDKMNQRLKIVQQMLDDQERQISTKMLVISEMQKNEREKTLKIENIAQQNGKLWQKIQSVVSQYQKIEQNINNKLSEYKVQWEKKGKTFKKLFKKNENKINNMSKSIQEIEGKIGKNEGNYGNKLVQQPNESQVSSFSQSSSQSSSSSSQQSSRSQLLQQEYMQIQSPQKQQKLEQQEHNQIQIQTKKDSPYSQYN